MTTTAKAGAPLDWYRSTLPGTLKHHEAQSVPRAVKCVDPPVHAASISVRAKSPPLHNRGSPVAMARASAKRRPQFSPPAFDDDRRFEYPDRTYSPEPRGP